MSVFEFIKDAGREFVRRGKAGAAQAKGEVTPDADDLREGLREQGLKPDELDIRIEGDAVHVGGRVLSRAEKEKLVVALGNTKGVRTVQEAIEAPDDGPSARLYTVKPGDTLSKIAQITYGDAKRYPMIFEANRPMLKDPDEIYPGQVLRIP